MERVCVNSRETPSVGPRSFPTVCFVCNRVFPALLFSALHRYILPIHMAPSREILDDTSVVMNGTSAVCESRKVVGLVVLTWRGEEREGGGRSEWRRCGGVREWDAPS